MAKIGFLGLGAMGTRMVMNLIKSGHEITVWNRTPEHLQPAIDAGATPADSPRIAADGVEFLISMVRDDSVSEEIWLHPETGALHGLNNHAIAIESSTITVKWARALAEHCAQAGVGFLDAPVAGSRPQAEAAQLIYFVGGEADVLLRAQPILELLSAAIHHAGANGSGAGVKLMINALFGIQLAALGELIGLMQHCDIDIEKAVEIISSTPVCSPAAKLSAMAMLTQNFAPMFPIELVEKDFAYVSATAETHAARTPISDVTRQLFAEALKSGYGDDNITRIASLY